jgi:hypothetical protein
MNAVVRVWLAFAAIGAALIHLAVGASAPLWLAVTLGGFGIAELGWGVAVLVRGRLLWPDVALVAGLAPVLLWGSVAALGSGFGLPPEAALPLFPLAVASLFDLFVTGVLAVNRRRAARAAPVGASAGATARGVGDEADAVSSPQDWRFLTGLIVAGFLFSGLTTPALAATHAGTQAVPHGSHSVPGLEFLDGGHSHH